jgi:uncharacterized protein (DUF433 family)
MALNPRRPTVLDNLPDFLKRCDDGEIVLRGHRITLYHVLDDYKAGKSAAQIAADYPSLESGVVDQVIAFCRTRRPEVDAYYADYQAALQRNYEAWKNSPMSRRGPSPQELKSRWIALGRAPLPGS